MPTGPACAIRPHLTSRLCASVPTNSPLRTRGVSAPDIRRSVRRDPLCQSNPSRLNCPRPSLRRSRSIAKVTKIIASVSGRKVHTAFGALALKISAEQFQSPSARPRKGAASFSPSPSNAAIRMPSFPSGPCVLGIQCSPLRSTLYVPTPRTWQTVAWCLDCLTANFFIAARRLPAFSLSPNGPGTSSKRSPLHTVVLLTVML
jgi:hypothetical protein